MMAWVRGLWYQKRTAIYEFLQEGEDDQVDFVFNVHNGINIKIFNYIF